jgi:hypothetical protein
VKEMIPEKIYDIRRINRMERGGQSIRIVI